MSTEEVRNQLRKRTDQKDIMEVTVLKGKTGAVQHFAEHVIAERGVRHGRIVLMPTQALPRSGRAPRRRHRHASHPPRG